MNKNCLKEGSKFKLNHKNKTDGLLLLADIIDGSITTTFFDPQYRGVLDKMKYGNEGSGRSKKRAELNQMDEATICKFIKEIERVLKPSGHLFLWIDKFHLCEGIHPWIEGTDLEIVDMITWDKCTFGMGYRSRRQAEYLMILQKKPKRVKGCWFVHNIRDVWSEPVKKNHPHSKPVELQQHLINATAKPGDYILDPASGGYSVLQACESTGCVFIGGDIEYGED